MVVVVADVDDVVDVVVVLDVDVVEVVVADVVVDVGPGHGLNSEQVGANEWP